MISAVLSTSYSGRFTEIGAALTVEAPAASRDADFADLAR